MHAENIPTYTPRLLARLGHAMRSHRRVIVGIQWFFVGLYVLLLALPLFCPHTDNRPTFLVPFLFWGIGWPLIFLSTMLLGRTWCGIFCPDGTLTEFVSRRGQNKSIPRWMRWPGWPCAVLVLVSLCGQLTNAYTTYPGTLLLLGLPTLGALCCGYLYGNGRRIWCMYLCPANAVFALLSKIAPIHFQIDEAKCRRAQTPFPPVHCPTLINIRQMKSASTCHMCAQCSGYLDAVELASRKPGSEILRETEKAVRTSDAITLLFGLLGVCAVSLLWKESAWFTLFKNTLAKAEIFGLQERLSILLFILIGSLLLGFSLLALLKLAANLANSAPLSWQRLSLALIPVGGTGIFSGLSSLTIDFLEHAGFALPWAPVARQFTLGIGALFSAWLGAKLLIQQRTVRQYTAVGVFLAADLLFVSIWL